MYDRGEDSQQRFVAGAEAVKANHATKTRFDV
jgi:hypothetical protein